MKEFKKITKKPAIIAGNIFITFKKLARAQARLAGKFAPSPIQPALSLGYPKKRRINPSVTQTAAPVNSYSNAKLKGWAASVKVLAVALVGLVSAFAPSLWTAVQPEPAKANLIFVAGAWGDGLIDVWWPTMNAQVTGTQPFKALLKNQPVENYKMYWQVDGGNLNEMPSNYEGYPHKQYDVDLTGWTWKGNGPYTISFMAKDNTGISLAQQNVTIYIGGQPARTTVFPDPAETGATTPAAPAPAAAATTQASSAPAEIQKPLDVWWPVNNSTLNGPTPFKALIQNSAISEYKMYWQMDGSQLTEMENSYKDYPHKESLVDVSMYADGSHTVTFVAQNFSGQTVGKSSISVNILNPKIAAATNNVTPAKLTPRSSQTNQPYSNTGNPFSGATLYVNPYTDPANWANARRGSDPYNASLMDKVASGAEVQWYGGWNSDVQKDVNNSVTHITNAGALPVMVAYNIPNRDCGGYSAGGVNSPDAYKSWIRAMAAGIGNRKAVVILEPDSLTLTGCLSSADLQTRYNLIRDAVSAFKANGKTSVYIDAGHPGWIPAGDMASRLKQAGVDQADGFALNIANFHTTESNLNYGKSISDLISGKHFVVDTGRNGSGPAPDYQWCNPSGRSLGQKPTTNTGNALADAYLWVKGPGGSDGNCNGGPNAGIFWPEYALGLASRTSW